MKTEVIDLIPLYEGYIIHKLLTSSDHKVVVEREQYEKDIATMDARGYRIHFDYNDDSFSFSLITDRN